MYYVRKGNVIKKLETNEQLKDYIRAGWQDENKKKEIPKKEAPKAAESEQKIEKANVEKKASLQPKKKEEKRKYVDFKF